MSVRESATRRYVIDGTKTSTLEGFFTAVGEAVNGVGGYFGTNLDAFGDCLSGGFGTPDDDHFTFVWTESRSARVHLGHAETARQLRFRLEECHPDNRNRVAQQLADAEVGHGSTVFDWLVEIFSERGHPVELR